LVLVFKKSKFERAINLEMNGTLNKVMLIGHLGDEIKMHYFEGGNCIGRFPLATNEVYINKQTNEKITSTEWHNLVVRNKAAEICEKYLSKGDKIFVEGRIKSRQWQAEDGSTKYTTEIQVTEFTFLTTKKDIDGFKSSQNLETKNTNFEPPTPTTPENDLPF
jgi:single-strand DNA-binding protein